MISLYGQHIKKNKLLEQLQNVNFLIVWIRICYTYWSSDFEFFQISD